MYNTVRIGIDETALSLDPGGLNGLYMWYDASYKPSLLTTGSAQATTTGQRIIRWKDRSTNKIDLFGSSGINTDGNSAGPYAAPTLSATSINGKSTLTFNASGKGSGYMLTGIQKLSAGSYTMFIVFSLSSNPVYFDPNYYQNVNSCIFQLGYESYGSSNNETGLFARSTATGDSIDGVSYSIGTTGFNIPLPINTFTYLSFTYDAKVGTAAAYISGSSVSPIYNAAGNTTTFDNPMAFGAYYFNWGSYGIGPAYEYYANTSIAEVIVYNRALNTSERQSVERYLSSKYAL